ncbi:hypothetical protein TRIUR3_22298 [Triticum urartu]|uniref:Uncharacterized protein n=1 Tax=Triticum urartu TaxID=4572 RepID=M7ZPR6_TRIUA|nr:hypothetical protein TRIUR3_22298 [Triticum urartu]
MEVGGVGVEAFVTTMMGVCDVGDTAMVAVVGSSPACSWDYLGLFCCGEVGAAAAGPCGDDDRHSTVWVGLTFVFGEVGVAFSEIREGDGACWGEVMTMTPVCDVDETLYVRLTERSIKTGKPDGARKTGCRLAGFRPHALPVPSLLPCRASGPTYCPDLPALRPASSRLPSLHPFCRCCLIWRESQHYFPTKASNYSSEAATTKYNNDQLQLTTATSSYWLQPVNTRYGHGANWTVTRCRGA